MKFGNINTQEIRESLPNVLVLAGQTISGADIRHWSQLGWRSVVEVEEPSAGCRVTGYSVEEIDGLTCRLKVSGEVNIDAEIAHAIDMRRALRWAGKTPTEILTNNKYGGLL